MSHDVVDQIRNEDKHEYITVARVSRVVRCANDRFDDDPGIVMRMRRDHVTYDECDVLRMRDAYSVVDLIIERVFVRNAYDDCDCVDYVHDVASFRTNAINRERRSRRAAFMICVECVARSRSASCAAIAALFVALPRIVRRARARHDRASRSYTSINRVTRLISSIVTLFDIVITPFTHRRAMRVVSTHDSFVRRAMSCCHARSFASPCDW